MRLEEVPECGRGNVDERVEGFFLGEPGAVDRQQVADVVAQVVFPVGLLHHHEDFAGLAADAGQQGTAVLAAGQGEGRCQGKSEEGKGVCFHIVLIFSLMDDS